MKKITYIFYYLPIFYILCCFSLIIMKIFELEWIGYWIVNVIMNLFIYIIYYLLIGIDMMDM